ncbi:Gdp-fucose protein o-fucosyltransferase [Thalictrum thalictroides]|uniref:Gdp-fucose protein o-fucosyltransferase n=1 Tax=Thalictrum thalictroides TaxID=46969 RepID=A0A7J6XEQ4_THATH|nr:Gdp-fucose protein o-fucosyltransferase [Thalictrum thalictroides]
MSTSGANSSNVSPRILGPTARRRVVDMETERSNHNNINNGFHDLEDHSSCFSDIDDDSSHQQHHSSLIHFLRKKFIYILESWIVSIENIVFWMMGLFKVSGKNRGRRILLMLLALVVCSVFLKVSLVRVHVEVNGKGNENGLVLQSYKDDSSIAQRVIDSETESTGSIVPQHVWKFPVRLTLLLLL